ncbi:MAG TPA: hypothetical protein VMI54_01525 [Polyangiaceae bacterium]|nr:hypothetical protein [Polyangiaceae bacterium]
MGAALEGAGALDDTGALDDEGATDAATAADESGVGGVQPATASASVAMQTREGLTSMVFGTS